MYFFPTSSVGLQAGYRFAKPNQPSQNQSLEPPGYDSFSSGVGKAQTAILRFSGKISEKLRFEHIIPYCLQYPSGPGKEYTHQAIAGELNKKPEVQALLPKGKILNGTDISDVYLNYINKGITTLEQSLATKGKGGQKISEELRFEHIIPYCLQYPSGKGKEYTHQAIADALNEDDAVKALLPKGKKIATDDISQIYRRLINQGITTLEQYLAQKGQGPAPQKTPPPRGSAFSPRLEPSGLTAPRSAFPNYFAPSEGSYVHSQGSSSKHQRSDSPERLAPPPPRPRVLPAPPPRGQGHGLLGYERGATPDNYTRANDDKIYHNAFWGEKMPPAPAALTYTNTWDMSPFTAQEQAFHASKKTQKKSSASRSQTPAPSKSVSSKIVPSRPQTAFQLADGKKRVLKAVQATLLPEQKNSLTKQILKDHTRKVQEAMGRHWGLWERGVQRDQIDTTEATLVLLLALLSNTTPLSQQGREFIHEVASPDYVDNFIPNHQHQTVWQNIHDQVNLLLTEDDIGILHHFITLYPDNRLAQRISPSVQQRFQDIQGVVVTDF